VNWYVAQFKWVMLVTGLLTCTVLYVAVAPQAALQSNFGEALSGPLAEIIVRNWGALITLTGALLIYGAFKPVHRRLILTLAVISKSTFVSLALIFGSQYLGRMAGISVAIDAAEVALYVIYLVATRGRPLAPSNQGQAQNAG